MKNNMNFLIEALIKLQQGILTEGATNAFNTLKTMPLENLEKKLEEAQANKNIAFVATIGNILEFGAINSNLSEFERAVLRKRISSKKELEKIRILLELFEELRAKIEPAIATHPLVKEHNYFKIMQPLASTQDEKLIEVAESYPQSILWLPSDSEKSRLESLYCQIKSFKGMDNLLFTETVMPDIIASINNSDVVRSLECLRSYLDGKNATLSNLDEEIQAMHLEAKTSMLRAPEKQKNEYLESSIVLENTQKEYLTLKRTLEKYQYPQSN